MLSYEAVLIFTDPFQVGNEYKSTFCITSFIKMPLIASFSVPRERREPRNPAILSKITLSDAESDFLQ